MRRFARLLFLTCASYTAAALVLYGSPALGGEPAGAGGKVARGLAVLKKALFEERAKILVRLDVPGIDELTLESNRYRALRPGRSFPTEGREADIALEAAVLSVSDGVIARIAGSGSDFRVIHTYRALPYLALELSFEGLALLSSLPEVLEIREDVPVGPIDPAAGPWPSTALRSDGVRLNESIPLIGADEAWAQGFTGAGWFVAVLDTGIRNTHEFFTGKTIVEACFSADGHCPDESTSMVGPGAAAHFENTYAFYDHGTHVTGIAAGRNEDYAGVARDSDIIAVQIYSRFPAEECGGTPCVMSYTSDQILGLDYVYSLRGTHSIAAVNVSLGDGRHGSPCDDDPRKEAVDNLHAVGIPTVIATGNNRFCGEVNAPACISTAVAVGASTKADAMASFSNWHETMQDLFAPGHVILSAGGWSDSTYFPASGTSMAAPHVTGAWALLKQAHPDVSLEEEYEALKNTGLNISTSCGGGASRPRVQIDRAIETCWDSDTDGHVDQACGGGDCDDDDPEIHPGHVEISDNGLDDDCDGFIDEPTYGDLGPYGQGDGRLGAGDLAIAVASALSRLSLTRDSIGLIDVAPIDLCDGPGPVRAAPDPNGRIDASDLSVLLQAGLGALEILPSCP